ncbi:MAG: hypothetical protein ACLVJQ_06505 [Lentihominibacter sp.]
MMWIVLVCASFCELGFTVCMKLSDGCCLDRAWDCIYSSVWNFGVRRKQR